VRLIALVIEPRGVNGWSSVDGGLNPRKSGGDDSKHEVISDSRHCLGIIGGLTAQRQVRRKEPVGRV